MSCAVLRRVVSYEVGASYKVAVTGTLSPVLVFMKGVRMGIPRRMAS